MKKLMILLSLIGFTFATAHAQKKCICPKKAKHNTASTMAYGGKSYAQNFKVCKDHYGYRICGEHRNRDNATYPVVLAQQQAGTAPQTPYYTQPNHPTYQTVVEANDQYRYGDLPADMLAPQSQSYPAQPNTLATNGINRFEGYYPNQGHIVVGTDNGTAPYEGKPSPQYDGPAQNQQRNLKVNSPEQNTTNPEFALPPSNGTGK